MYRGTCIPSTTTTRKPALTLQHGSMPGTDHFARETNNRHKQPRSLGSMAGQSKKRSKTEHLNADSIAGLRTCPACFALIAPIGYGWHKRRCPALSSASKAAPADLAPLTPCKKEGCERPKSAGTPGSPLAADALAPEDEHRFACPLAPETGHMPLMPGSHGETQQGLTQKESDDSVRTLHLRASQTIPQDSTADLVAMEDSYLCKVKELELQVQDLQMQLARSKAAERRASSMIESLTRDARQQNKASKLKVDIVDLMETSDASDSGGDAVADLHNLDLIVSLACGEACSDSVVDSLSKEAAFHNLKVMPTRISNLDAVDDYKACNVEADPDTTIARKTSEENAQEGADRELARALCPEPEDFQMPDRVQRKSNKSVSENFDERVFKKGAGNCSLCGLDSLSGDKQPKSTVLSSEQLHIQHSDLPQTKLNKSALEDNNEGVCHLQLADTTKESTGNSMLCQVDCPVDVSVGKGDAALVVDIGYQTQAEMISNRMAGGLSSQNDSYCGDASGQLCIKAGTFDQNRSARSNEAVGRGCGLAIPLEGQLSLGLASLKCQQSSVSNMEVAHSKVSNMGKATGPGCEKESALEEHIAEVHVGVHADMLLSSTPSGESEFLNRRGRLRARRNVVMSDSENENGQFCSTPKSDSKCNSGLVRQDPQVSTKHSHVPRELVIEQRLDNDGLIELSDGACDGAEREETILPDANVSASVRSSRRLKGLSLGNFQDNLQVGSSDVSFGHAKQDKKGGELLRAANHSSLRRSKRLKAMTVQYHSWRQHEEETVREAGTFHEVTKPTEEACAQGSNKSSTSIASENHTRRKGSIKTRRQLFADYVESESKNWSERGHTSENEECDEDSENSEGSSLGGFIVDGSSDNNECVELSEEEGSSIGEKARSEEPQDSCSGESSSSSSQGCYPSFRRIMEIKRKNYSWDFEGEMLAMLETDPALCLRAVCALYRRQTEDEQIEKGCKYVNKRGFDKFHAARGSLLANFLMDGNPDGPVKRSLSDLEKRDSTSVDYCKKLAFKHSKQLFEIYKSGEDPHFPYE